jgi:hypothetical protein
LLWEHAAPPGNPGVPRAVQPRVVGPSQVLFDAGPDLGTVLLDVARANGSWLAEERWVSRYLKPSFNDFVVYDNAIYGFDGRVLSCIDLQTGQRRWKEGRYGSGQILLLSDQALLVVVTDDGEVVLVAADQSAHREFGRFRALQSKTWNHPVIAHGRLYIRNAEEIACYEIRLAASLAASGRHLSPTRGRGPRWRVGLNSGIGHGDLDRQRDEGRSYSPVEAVKMCVLRKMCLHLPKQISRISDQRYAEILMQRFAEFNGELNATGLLPS